MAFFQLTYSLLCWAGMAICCASHLLIIPVVLLGKERLIPGSFALKMIYDTFITVGHRNPWHNIDMIQMIQLHEELRKQDLTLWGRDKTAAIS